MAYFDRMAQGPHLVCKSEAVRDPGPIDTSLWPRNFVHAVEVERVCKADDIDLTVLAVTGRRTKADSSAPADSAGRAPTQSKDDVDRLLAEAARAYEANMAALRKADDPGGFDTAFTTRDDLDRRAERRAVLKAEKETTVSKVDPLWVHKFCAANGVTVRKSDRPLYMEDEKERGKRELRERAAKRAAAWPNEV